VARAKRTNRAEARRRYRAQIAEQANADTPETDERPVEPSARGPRGPRGPRDPRPAAEPQRSGMRYAFRAAFREPNLREDIEHLPELLRSRAILLPILISVGTAVAIAATSGTDVISRLLAQYFLVPPPIGSIFIAGFFAPRASYLAGLIVGLVAAIALTILIAVTPTVNPGVATPGASAGPSAATSPAAGSPSASASAAPSASATASASASPAASAGASPAASGAGQPITQNPADVAGFALIASPIAGIFFASAAAWYRRFLQLSNPNRAAARGGQKARPSNRRR
jgi:hypothetical protein